MANKSLITQEQMQNDLENFYSQKIYPYLNGSANLGFTPIGTVISVMSNEAPDNYLVCDGTAYNISEYSDLANFFEDQFGSKNYFGGDGTTTFAVPDLRGEFLRGTGTNGHTDQGSGANVGVHQDATTFPILRNNKDELLIYGRTKDTEITVSNPDFQVRDGKYYAVIQDKLLITPLSDNGETAIATRPTNTSVLYCIAYKDIFVSTTLDGAPVDTSDLQDGQVLVYDATNQKWANDEINTLHVYSTTEHVVGTWIDGRPVYERVIEGSFPLITQGTNADVPVKVSDNIKEFCEITSFVPTGNNYIPFGTFWYLSGQFLYVKYYSCNHNATTNKDSIVFSSNNEAFSNSDFYCRVRYTKTTDTV